MEMTTRGRVLLLIGFAALLLSALFPPRIYIDRLVNEKTSAPRGFLFDSSLRIYEHPQAGSQLHVEIDTPRMFGEWMVIASATGLALLARHRKPSQPVDTPFSRFLEKINW